MQSEQKVPDKKKRFSLSRRKRTKLSNYFTEYCDSTSIHGFKYLGEQKRSRIEKFWWLITIFVSVCVLVHLILDTTDKWYNSPVIVSFATKQTPIWQVPFPAVTICPETKLRQTKFNFTAMYRKKFRNLSNESKSEFMYSSLICKTRYSKAPFNQYPVLTDKLLDFLDETSPHIHNISIKCKWIGEDMDCQELFTPVLTDIGVCYTFNMLKWDDLFNPNVKPIKNYLQHNKSSGWKLEVGYGPNETINAYPLRALYDGANNGLQITMVAYKKDMDYICGDAMQGYKVLLHHPADLPRVGRNYFRLPLDQTVSGVIKPDIMTTSDDLQYYSAETRRCFMPNERNLTFFKIYTQQNCEIECLANFTLETCSCVGFYMPRENGTQICGPGSKICMKISENALRSSNIVNKLNEIRKNEEESNNITRNSVMKHINKVIRTLTTWKSKAENNKKICECLPACTTVSYTADTSQTDWDWVQNMRGIGDVHGFLAENYVDGQKQAHLSKLILFFKETQLIASERNELYGLTDLLANCGGLLSLFTGFSVISLVEVIYFLTIRWTCNMRLKKQR